MKFQPASMNTNQLRGELIEAYVRAKNNNMKETQTVTTLKNEIYRHGVDRDEVVRIALAALMRDQK